jgi:hypothetical protein
MKLSKKSLLLTMSTGIFFLPAILSAEPRFGSSAGPNNYAVFASPRFLEEHPELLRVAPSTEFPSGKTGRVEEMVNLNQKATLATSPRFIEEHPELQRIPPSPEKATARARRERERLNELMQNTALAVSPRFLEEHSELAGKTLRFEVTPLK